jgi:hypothetical protein
LAQTQRNKACAGEFVRLEDFQQPFGDQVQPFYDDNDRLPMGGLSFSRVAVVI